MEFIAEDRIRVKVRSEQLALHDTRGRQVEPSKRRVFAQFERGNAPIWAREQAARLYSFDRMPQGTTPERWLSYYNSADDQILYGWTDEERAAIEQALLEVHSAVLVERPKVAAPWPAYDKLTVTGRRTIEHVVEKIVAAVTDLGLEPKAVVDYERENLNRPEVLAAMEALAEGEKEEEPEPLIAA